MPRKNNRNSKPIPEGTSPFDLAIMDLDTLPYIFGWVHEDVQVGMKAIDAWLISVMDYLKVEQSIGFIKGASNFRMENDKAYKAKRKDSIAPEIRARIDALYDYLLHIATEGEGAEADDYCCIQMYQELSDGNNPVLVHVDKDLNQIPGWHYNPKKNEVYFVLPEEAYAFTMQQLLIGDYTDGIVGIPGRGPGWADAVLSQNPQSLVSLYKFIKALFVKEFKSPTKGYSEFYKTANLIYLRTNLEDLRWLTPKELDEKLAWTGDPGLHYFPKQQPGIRQLKVDHVDGPPLATMMVEQKWNQENELERLGNAGVKLILPTTSPPSASSIRSHVSQRVKDTSGRSRFTSIVAERASARVTGVTTKVVVKKSRR